MSKKYAAMMLGVSLRQIERRESQGYIEKRKAERRMGESTARSEYSRADIEALKAGTPNVHAREVSQTEGYIEAIREAGEESQKARKPENGAGKALATRPPNSWPSFEERIGAFVATLQANPLVRAPQLRPWLTLDEAVAFSGLPRAFLVAKAVEGVPWAIDVCAGGTRAFWRFNREGLGKI